MMEQDIEVPQIEDSQDIIESEKVIFLNSVNTLDIDSDPMDENPKDSSNDEPQSKTNSITHCANENGIESEKVNVLNSLNTLDIDSDHIDENPIDSSNDEPQSLTNSITNFVNENGIESDNDCDDTLLDDSVEEPYEQNFKKLKEFKDAMKRKEKEEMENAQIKSAESKRLSLKANEDVIKKPFVSVERL